MNANAAGNWGETAMAVGLFLVVGFGPAVIGYMVYLYMEAPKKSHTSGSVRRVARVPSAPSPGYWLACVGWILYVLAAVGSGIYLQAVVGNRARPWEEAIGFFAVVGLLLLLLTVVRYAWINRRRVTAAITYAHPAGETAPSQVVERPVAVIPPRPSGGSIPKFLAGITLVIIGIVIGGIAVTTSHLRPSVEGNFADRAAYEAAVDAAPKVMMLPMAFFGALTVGLLVGGGLLIRSASRRQMPRIGLQPNSADLPKQPNRPSGVFFGLLILAGFPIAIIVAASQEDGLFSERGFAFGIIVFVAWAIVTFALSLLVRVVRIILSHPIQSESQPLPVAPLVLTPDPTPTNVPSRPVRWEFLRKFGAFGLLFFVLGLLALLRVLPGTPAHAPEEPQWTLEQQFTGLPLEQRLGVLFVLALNVFIVYVTVRVLFDFLMLGVRAESASEIVGVVLIALVWVGGLGLSVFATIHTSGGAMFFGGGWRQWGMLAALYPVFGFILVCAAYGMTAGRNRPLEEFSPVPPTDYPIPPESTPTSGTCPTCGNAIPAGSPQGLCPRCLIRGVMPSINATRARSTRPIEPPPPAEVNEFFPHLQVLELVGAGGMGAVYKARQPNLDRVVALKIVQSPTGEDDPVFAERFAREARAMARLDHPNIVTIHESGEAGGLPYMLMEFVDGITLRDAMENKVLTTAEALAVIPQICDALDYAHRTGVVHRDIKPENILIDQTGRVKIADFGLAKLAEAGGLTLTHTRQAMGTPHYMAPEQWEKPNAVDHRADIYALGVVLYELLTGELPLGRFDLPSAKGKGNARMDQVVLRALAKEPGQRYQHASDLKNELSGLGNWWDGPMPRRGHYEYRSKRMFLSLPLVHVVRGKNPATGKLRVAKGWIAVSDGVAVGGIAVGGVSAVGGITVAGVFSVGLLAIGGAIGIGLLALAGTAIGMFGAVGGVAVSPWLAVGGVAIGYFAIGGSAIGQYTLGGTGNHPEFWDVLRRHLPNLIRW